jgi:N-acetylmuramic acid 6-phosphate etherase
MALNILSTGVMVRLGTVHGNRMVDVAVTNAKLEDRALRILMDLGGISRQEAADQLAAADGSVKLALLMSLTGLGVQQAVVLLANNGYSLRAALAGEAGGESS